MDDLKVTRIDLTELDIDSLDSIEASGGNWKRVGKYVYKIVNTGSKCSFNNRYINGPNEFSGTRKTGCCSSCKNLVRKGKVAYWVCMASERREV